MSPYVAVVAPSGEILNDTGIVTGTQSMGGTFSGYSRIAGFRFFGEAIKKKVVEMQFVCDFSSFRNRISTLFHTCESVK